MLNNNLNKRKRNTDLGLNVCGRYLFSLRALQGVTLLPPQFQGLTALTGLECFVINELLCPGLGETESSVVFIAQQPSRRVGNGGGERAGGREGRATESTCHNDQRPTLVSYMLPGCWLLAFFTQVCQLDVSVLFTNEEAQVLNS